MPNHCSNTLTVVGPEKDLSKFLAAIESKKDDKQDDNLCSWEGGRLYPLDEEDETGGHLDDIKYSILDNLYPVPQELKDTVSGFYGGDTEKQKALETQQEANRQKYGYKDWYDWANANWGTKWGDYDTELSDGPTYTGDTVDGERIATVTLRYTTAWAPAINGIVKVSGMFPTLKFLGTYDESGMGFFGAFGAFAGELSQDLGGKYPDIDIDWDADDAHDQWEKHQDTVLQECEKLEILVGTNLGVYKSK